MEQLGCRWTDFREVLLKVSLKYFDEVQIMLKLDNKDSLHEEQRTFIATSVTNIAIFAVDTNR
jgi:hypothetical protein